MDFVKYSNFSEDQKTEFLELAKVLVSWSEKARFEGILALEEDLAVFKTETKVRLFLKKTMMLVTDGFDSVAVRQIGERYIQHDNADGFERLAFEMILEGVLSIQSGDNPFIMIEVLASFTGIFESAKFIEELHKLEAEVRGYFGENHNGSFIEEKNEQ
ncbi:MAG: hypothetical protein IIT57_06090 [Treponema sp.]|jgi:flagellar motor component MotA|nr:hypothetical protein [Treponema sp.]